MAEGLLKAVDPLHFDVVSAGIKRGEIHPLTLEVMREINIDLEGQATKAAQDFGGLGFDFVITLCDRSRTDCPMFLEAEVVHWQFHNPMSANNDHTNQTRMFRSLRDQIAQRIRLFALVQARSTEIDTRNYGASRPADLVHF